MILALLLWLVVWLARPCAVSAARAMPPGAAPRTVEKPFRPQGSIDRELWGATDDEIMVAGPAGTGKSRGILEYLYALTIKYPGSRGLIVRLTRESLTHSALATFEDHVVPGRPRWVTNQMRRVRQSYLVPSGPDRTGVSEIVVGGLDNSAKYMSTEFDWIYVQEAREIEEAAWEDLTSRLGRNNKMPFSFIIGDTNPDGPMHWILQRAQAHKLRLIESRHQDNPLFWSERIGDWTEAGRRYWQRLSNLTGVRLKRLRDGLWVGAENLIYDLFDPAVHVITPTAKQRRAMASWPVDLSVDFGYSDPFCAQFWAEDHDGRIYLVCELYGTHRLTKEWAHLLCAIVQDRGYKLRNVITDHDLTHRLDLETHMGHREEECPDRADTRKGREWASPVVPSVPAVKDIQRGIQAVQARLKKAGDGYPRLFLVKECRIEIDERLKDMKVPTCTEEEFPRYVRAKKRSLTAGEVLLEEPVDRDNHGMDAMRYRVMHSDADLFPASKLMGKTITEVVS